MKQFKRKYFTSSSLTIFSVFIDQASKKIVSMKKDLFTDGIEVYNFFNLVYVENRGISFGIFSKYELSFYLGILSFLISIYIGYLIKITQNKFEAISLSLILGGAIGNGIDRVKNNYVIDFFDFHIGVHHWPAFNFADAFITVGGVMFFWQIFFKNPEKK
tara:strand:- start:1181 stop:1660 length:480 start_codon:yes stop_codon:yes gene_type:complete